MANQKFETAHGGSLKQLVVSRERAEVLKELSANLNSITLNGSQLCDLELLATGAFSPLEGFMVRGDYESVVDRMQLRDGTLWPLPVCLDIGETVARNLEAGQSLALRDPEGFLLAVMHIEDIWPVLRHKEVEAVFGTTEQNHPGVRHFLRETGDYYIGGKLEVISLPLHYDFKSLRLSPGEMRRAFRKLGWNRIVGYQTSTVMHRPQFELTLEAMRRSEANLLLMPMVGVTRTDEFDYYTRVRCYRQVLKHYPPDSTLLSLLPYVMRMAGIREVLLNATVAKNYGCTHFVVQQGHAGLGCHRAEQGCCDWQAAQAHMANCDDDLGVSLIFFDDMSYLPFEDEHRFFNDIPEGTQTIKMTGSDIRSRIKTGRTVPEWASFPEVLDELRRTYPPPEKQGFTVFLTGLSGAGKSTIAKVLFSKILEIGERPVTLLDGDIVRQNLSSELSFSKEHRDINVRRIGFVAGEITKNRGVAICAPIAPYERTRQEIRQDIEAYGGFVEVHVATPLGVCEKRDRKGMYAKARAGLIKGYTGIDDPYESPKTPELRIDTTEKTPDEAAHEILLFLGQKGYI